MARAVNPPVGGLILAGGRGERLGGCEKGLLRIEGEPYAARLIRLLAQHVSPVAVSANASLDEYARWADAVLPDHSFPQDGPLAGLYEGLLWASQKDLSGLLVTSCDTPLLPQAWVERLMESARGEPQRTHLTRLAEGDQPLHGYFPVTALPLVRDALNSGERRARRLAQSLSPVWVDCAALSEGFFNVNSPEDQARLS